MQASVVVAQGLSCSAAYGIFPDQGLNPCPLHAQWILNHCATREVQMFELFDSPLNLALRQAPLLSPPNPSPVSWSSLDPWREYLPAEGKVH